MITRIDAGKGLQLTLLDREPREIEHVEPYGFTSRPLKGAEVIAVSKEPGAIHC